MKRIMMATALLLAGAFALMAQDHAKSYNASHSNTANTVADQGAMCMGKDGKTNCSDKELQTLGMAAGKRRHQAMTLTLDKSGSLQCDRTPCTADQLKDVITEAAPLGLKVTSGANSGGSRSNTSHN
jgi:hypothetical protein